MPININGISSITLHTVWGGAKSSNCKGRNMECIHYYASLPRLFLDVALHVGRDRSTTCSMVIHIIPSTNLKTDPNLKTQNHIGTP